MIRRPWLKSAPWVAGLAVVTGLAFLARTGVTQFEVSAVPSAADLSRDIGHLYDRYHAAEEESWRVFNAGNADAIGATAGARRAAALEVVAALGNWTPVPGATEFQPIINAAFLARRLDRPDVARSALARLAEVVPADHPDYGLVQFTWGALAAEAKAETAALAAFEKAAAAPAFAVRDQALFRLAELRAARGDSAAALATLEEILAVAPPSLYTDRVNAARAADRFRRGDHAGALALAEALRGSNLKGDEKARNTLLAARAARGLDQVATARASYLSVMTEFPSSRSALDAWNEFNAWRGGRLSPEERLAGATVLFRAGREDAGFALLQAVIDDAAIPVALRVDAADKAAFQHYTRRRYEPARQAWRRMEAIATTLPGRRADARIGIARTYRNSGNVVEMERVYGALAADTARETQAAKATWELAREYKSLGRFADCEEVLTGYIARHPGGEDYMQALLLRGLCRFMLGRTESAESDFRTFRSRSERRTDRETGGYWEARAQLDRGNREAAIEALRTSLAYDLPDGYYGYRIRSLLQGLVPADSAAKWVPEPVYDASRDPLEADLPESTPAAARVHYERGLTLLRAGFRDEGQAELNRGAELNPNDGIYLEMTSALAARLGLHAYAMTAARRAMPRADSKTSEARLWRYIYALGHYDLIAPAALANDLDPMLVAALIRQESLFDARALSRAGAKGLMQLMLPTARAVASARGDAPPSDEDLYRPELSVTYGTHYLRDKLAEFGDEVEVALAAYNAGEAKAREWAALPVRKPPALIKEHPHLRAFDPDLFMELIDYAETKDYVRRVRYNQETLHLFYDPPAGSR